MQEFQQRGEGLPSVLQSLQDSDMQCLHMGDSGVQLFLVNGGLLSCKLALSFRDGGSHRGKKCLKRLGIGSGESMRLGAEMLKFSTLLTDFKMKHRGEGLIFHGKC